VRPRLLPILADLLKDRDIAELSADLEAAGLPYAPIRRPEQLVDDVHLRESGGIVPMQTSTGETDVVLLPLMMAGKRLGVLRPLPSAGEHNDQFFPKLSD